MSKQAIVDGYLRGSMSRRTFVRRLTGTGLSLGAALSYADLLGPNNAAATVRPSGQPYYDYYDYYDYYEQPTPPAVTTEPPTDVQQNSVTAWAIVDPHRADTHAWFKLRPAGTLAWTETAHKLVAGDEPQNVSIAIGGLASGTAFDIQAVARNSAGQTAGAIVRFTTAAVGLSPVPPSDSGAPRSLPAVAAPLTLGLLPPAAATHRDGPKVRLGDPPSLHSVQKHGVITLPVFVDQNAVVVVAAKKGVRHHRKRGRAASSQGMVRIARDAQAVAHGGRALTVKLRLNRLGRQVLKDRRTVDVLIEVQAENSDGQMGTTRNVVRLVG